MRFEAYKIVLTREQFIEPQPSRLAHVFVKKGRNFDRRAVTFPTFFNHRPHETLPQTTTTSNFQNAPNTHHGWGIYTPQI